jgi:hypothetical protein
LPRPRLAQLTSTRSRDMQAGFVLRLRGTLRGSLNRCGAAFRPQPPNPCIHILPHALELAMRHCAAVGISLTRHNCEGCMARGRRASRARLLKWSETYRLHDATACRERACSRPKVDEPHAAACRTITRFPSMVVFVFFSSYSYLSSSAQSVKFATHCPRQHIRYAT